MTQVKIVIKDLHACTKKDLINTINILLNELITRPEETT